MRNVFLWFVCLLLLSTSHLHAKQARIINGSTAAVDEVPWQVALIENPASPSAYCGGTIIHEEWIVTAAHCAPDNANGTTTYIVAGTHDLTPSSTAYQNAQKIRGVWHVHPDYDDVEVDNDIALIELDSPIDLDSCSGCTAIDVVTVQTEATAASNGTLATVSGWGLTDENDDNSYTSNLQTTQVNLMSCTQSPSLYVESEITANMICAATSNFDTDACQGDSGGPLAVANSEGTGYLLAGVVSWGEGCALQSYPGVYARVAQYQNWFRSFNTELAPPTPSGGGTSSHFLLWLLLPLLFQKFKARKDK